MTWKERLVRFRSFWIFPAISGIALAFTHLMEPGNRFPELVWLLPAGVLTWTLLEYGLHRFVFHFDITNPVVRSVVSGSHLEHHETPRDLDHLLVRTGYALGVSALAASGIGAIVQNWFWTAGIMSGIWLGFLYYESVHYRVHVTAAKGGLIGRQRRAHFYHHHQDSQRGFGVTTPLWDYVFGTLTSAWRMQRQGSSRLR